MTCKGCVHYEVCNLWSTTDLEKDEAHKYCYGRFKPKSRFIELPCEVGQTVYAFKRNGELAEGIVESIHQNRIGCVCGRWIVTVWFDNFYADSKEAGFECGTNKYLPFEDFGKTIFLSREEAEKSLKGENA